MSEVRDNWVNTNEFSERIKPYQRKDYFDHFEKFQHAATSKSESDSDSNSDFDEDEEDDEYSSFPITHELEIETGSKRITSLALNKASSEFVVGAQDSTLKFYIYNQLQLNRTVPYLKLYPFTEETTISEFGTTNESGNYLIKKIVNDPSNDNYLVLPNHSQFKVLDSKGNDVWKSTKGDIYIQDYGLTKGHVNDIQDGIISGYEILTCGKDATIRKWDLVKEIQESVSFFRSLRRDRGSVDTLSKCGQQSNQLISSDSSGAISVFDITNLNKPTEVIKDESPVMSLVVNEFNKNQIVTRNTVGEVKIYDLRKFESPIVTRADFHHSNSYQNLQISNNGSYLIGATIDGSQRNHQLQILELTDLSTKYKLNFPFEPTCVKWDYNINQIMVGGTKGNVITLFSGNNISQKGIKLLFTKPIAKRALRSEDEEYFSERNIIYNAEDLAKQNNKVSRKRAKADNVVGVNYQEKEKDIAVFGKKDPRYIDKNIEFSDLLHQDPRKELLKYAKKK